MELLFNSPIKLADCDKHGISEIHFHGAEQTIWKEIIRAEGEGRPFDYSSLSDHLANTRNGDGVVLVARLGDCMCAEVAPASLPDHCRALISTQVRREALLLGNELAQAAKRRGDRVTWRFSKKSETRG